MREIYAASLFSNGVRFGSPHGLWDAQNREARGYGHRQIILQFAIHPNLPT